MGHAACFKGNQPRFSIENKHNAELEININQDDSVPQESFTPPDQSGPIAVLPWEANVDFLKAKKDWNTPVLMAAFVTVLKDPLPGEEYNVHLAASLLAGRIVKPGQIFSQNNSIGPYVEAKGYRIGPTYMDSRVVTTIGGGVCKISSALYNVSILSNLEIIERHNHGMPVPYVPYGQDATVAYGVKDFKFKNNLDFPILIWAMGIENNLYIAFYGKNKPPAIEWHHEILEIRPAGKKYRINPQLAEGEERLIMQGMDGARVKSHVLVKYTDGREVRRDLGVSSYRPMAHVYEKKSH